MRRIGWMGMAAFMMLAACGQAQNTPQELPVRSLMVKSLSLRVQVADDDSERAKGLMFVKAMPENQGMLFIWPEAEERSFWMHNTYIPLDIIYIQQGKIVSMVQWAQPLNDTALPSGVPADMVLEMNGGWAARHGVQIGDAVTLP